jgi:hypothetical protein
MAFSEPIPASVGHTRAPEYGNRLSRFCLLQWRHCQTPIASRLPCAPDQV